MRILRASGRIEAPRERVFALLEDPRVQDSLNPEFLSIEVLETPWLPKPGARTRLRLRHRGIELRLDTETVEYRRGALLRERQVNGPFATFERAIHLEDDGAVTLVTEVLAYQLRFGPLGRLFDLLAVRRDLEELLRTRLARLAALFARH